MEINQIRSTTTAYPTSVTTPVSTSNENPNSRISNTTPNMSSGVSLLTTTKAVDYSPATAAETSSTTVTYGSSSTTASTTASSTEYPYLLHQGSEVINRAEKMLMDLGYDTKKDGDLESGLTKFRKAYGLESYGIYSQKVATKLNEVWETTQINAMKKTNSKFKEQLIEMGFCDKTGKEENMVAFSYSAPNDVLSACENFCKVYGLDYDNASAETISKKIKEVYSCYTSALESAKESKLFSDLKLTTDTQKKTVALTWAFLKKGMKLSDAQAVGVMANIHAESRFSATNAQNACGYKGDFNPENGELYGYSKPYKFKTGDSVGYGILQWTNKARKEGLSEVAEEMGLSVSNINAQFATIREEANGSEKSAWKALKDTKDYSSSTSVFMKQYLRPADGDLSQRKEYAELIYNALCA